MAGNTRTTITGTSGKFMSRTPGERAGLQINTFGIGAIKAALNGPALAAIVLEALTPAYDQAYAEWPVKTGASRDSMSTEVIEEGEGFARAALLVGGDQLRSDPRNKSRKDYAPFVEFNRGVILHAMVTTETEAKDIIRAGVAQLIAEATNGS